MATPATGTAGDAGASEVDVGFAQDMIDHHDQAVQLALLVVHRTDLAEVRTIAVSIISGQQREAGMLEQFLRDRGIAPADPDRDVMAWMGHPVPHDQMPGLATDAEILALTDASDPDLDRLFLELMVRHHEGGVHMAEHALAHASSDDIRDLAGRISVAQRREIADLRLLLGE